MMSRLPSGSYTTDVPDAEIPCFLSEDWLTSSTVCWEDQESDSEEHLDLIEEKSPQIDYLLALQEHRPPPNMDRISLEEFAREQATDPFCKETLARIHKKETTSFKEDEKSGLIVRSVRGSNQILVPETLRPRLLALAHHSPPAAHPGGRKMYMTLRTTFYWPSMVVDVYTTVRNCKSCAMERVRARFRHTKLKLFPASAPLEDIAMDLCSTTTA